LPNIPSQEELPTLFAFAGGRRTRLVKTHRRWSTGGLQKAGDFGEGESGEYTCHSSALTTPRTVVEYTCHSSALTTPRTFVSDSTDSRLQDSSYGLIMTPPREFCKRLSKCTRSSVSSVDESPHTSPQTTPRSELCSEYQAFSDRIEHIPSPARRRRSSSSVISDVRTRSTSPLSHAQCTPPTKSQQASSQRVSKTDGSFHFECTSSLHVLLESECDAEPPQRNVAPALAGSTAVAAAPVARTRVAPCRLQGDPLRALPWQLRSPQGLAYNLRWLQGLLTAVVGVG
jgi:hypothetical protein